MFSLKQMIGNTNNDNKDNKLTQTSAKKLLQQLDEAADIKPNEFIKIKGG